MTGPFTAKYLGRVFTGNTLPKYFAFLFVFLNILLRIFLAADGFNQDTRYSA